MEKMLNEQQTNAEMDRIKYLFGYDSKNSNTTNSMRMNEGKKVEDMLGRQKTNEIRERRDAIETQ